MFDYRPPDNFKPLFVFTADNHVKRRIWKSIPEIEYDTYNSLQQICDFCSQQNLPLVVGGDLFDSRTPTASDVNFVSKQFATLTNGVYCLDGNHDGYGHVDASEEDSWVNTVGATCVNGKKFTVGDLTLYGQPYALPTKLEEDLSKLGNDIDILICHQLLQEIIGSTMISNMQANWVPGHIKTILLGDYHKQSSFTSLDDQYFVYPGSTAPMRFSEAEQKYFMVVGSKGKLITCVTVPLLTRSLLSYSVTDKAELDGVVKTIKRFVQGEKQTNEDNPYYTPISRPYVRLSYDSSLSGVQAAIGKLSDLAYIESEPFGSNALRIDPTQLESTHISPAQIMDQLVDKKENPALYSFGLDLVGTEDFTAVFDAKREELGVKAINDN